MTVTSTTSDQLWRHPGRAARQLLTYPFRIFFLSLAVLAVIVIPLWLLAITGYTRVPLGLPAPLWHQHELVFGWLYAGIGGFLLTAVCVWTKTTRLQGGWLFGLWLVWLAGRGVTVAGANLPDALIIAANLAFMPLVIVDVGRRVWAARQARQLPILAILAALWGMQAGFFLAPGGAFIHGALVATMALMLAIGGRITPNFSRAWLRRQGFDVGGIRVIPALDNALLLALAALLLGVLADYAAFTVTAAVTGAGLSLVRTLLWQGWRTRSEPLLWILHVSLLWIPVALLLLAGSALGWWPATVWVHAAGVGAMGGLMLGMISRVALGHTGRALQLPTGLPAAFVLIHIAALVRVATGLGWLGWQPGLIGAGILWVAAFGLYLMRYAGILMRPRADGQPG